MHGRHSAAVWVGAILLVCGVISGCASTDPDEPSNGPVPSVSSSEEPASADPTPSGEADPVDPVDPVDPASETRRGGPSAQFGGPPFGSQGVEAISADSWCVTLAVFWGGDPPTNATFTITGVAADPAVLAADAAAPVCGTLGADRTCIGLTMGVDLTNAFCSIELIRGPDFVSPTVTDLAGTLECTEAVYCDQAIALALEKAAIADPGSTPVIEVTG